ARLLGILFGDGCIFLCGIAWLILSTGLSPSIAFLVGVLPFIPGDVVKGYAVWVIGERLDKVNTMKREEVPGT
ncbi:MAG TPA: biotin transporter BioY, partial [Methanoregulaceae archaeon]|nr:biotin transporter BioY [Methanoregulaceae archaeon]